MKIAPAASTAPPKSGYVPVSTIPYAAYRVEPAKLTPLVLAAAGSPHYIGQATGGEGRVLMTFEAGNFTAGTDPLAAVAAASHIVEAAGAMDGSEDSWGGAMAITQAKNGTVYLAPVTYGGFDDNGWGTFKMTNELSIRKGDNVNLLAVVGANRWVNFGIDVPKS